MELLTLFEKNSDAGDTYFRLVLPMPTFTEIYPITD